MTQRAMIRSFIFLLILCPFVLTQAYAQSCEKIVRSVNARLTPRIDEHELVEVLRYLNTTDHKKLPPRFVSKRDARSRGWRPGKDLWSVNNLRGSSIGGDRFHNREGHLQYDQWREADLDYRGGRRGAKRLVFSRSGDRFVTVDHYQTFLEIPPCE